MSSREQITSVLLAVSAGEDGAFDRLFDLVYQELKRVARAQLRRLRPAGALDTTELVHEAYLKFVDQSRVRLEDRSHFYAVCARAMRQILVDHARRLGRAKRGAGAQHLELDEAKIPSALDWEEILAIDEALTRLAAYGPRLARTVEYRFFVGLSPEEIAELHGVTSRTVRNDWTRAKAWLAAVLEERPPSVQPSRPPT
ncbi:MAG TPA: ECF-type sigma factor [Thermoanaerobaculia bacterium]|nr:ECF-type sigma factor [Thermoanaerobaculia bacterium]